MQSKVVRKVIFLKPKASPGPIKVIGTNSDPAYELEKYQAHSSDELILMGGVDGSVYPLKWWEEQLGYWHQRSGWYKATPQVLCAIEDALAGRVPGLKKSEAGKVDAPKVKTRKGIRPLKYRTHLMASDRRTSMPVKPVVLPERTIVSEEEAIPLIQLVLRNLGAEV